MLDPKTTLWATCCCAYHHHFSLYSSASCSEISMITVEKKICAFTRCIVGIPGSVSVYNLSTSVQRKTMAHSKSQIYAPWEGSVALPSKTWIGPYEGNPLRKWVTEGCFEQELDSGDQKLSVGLNLSLYMYLTLLVYMFERIMEGHKTDRHTQNNVDAK